MRLYFIVLDGERFADIAQALGLAWRQRSFSPCQRLCRHLWQEERAAPENAAWTSGILARVADGGLFFDHRIWRMLAAEILLLSAAAVPEIETMPATMNALNGFTSTMDRSCRAQFSWLDQVHYGTQDLCFGGGYYRPQNAGWNSRLDVCRLADQLGTVRPELWHEDSLAILPELKSLEDRLDELAFAREWFGPLRDMYHSAAQEQRVIVCESP